MLDCKACSALAAIALAILSGADPANAAASERPIVIAQAGSIGGSIGKQGKSISGGEESSAPKQGTPSPARRAPSQDRSTSRDQAKPGCPSIAGTWSWTGGLFGKNDTVFNQDGTARHRSGIVGTWTCRGGDIYLHWKNWWNGTLHLSADRRRLITVSSGKAAFVR